MAKRIVNLTGLAERMGISRSQLYQYIDSQRIRREMASYIDNEGHMYFTEKRAQELVNQLQAQKGLSRRIRRKFE